VTAANEVPLATWCTYSECDEPATHQAAWPGGTPFALCRRHASVVRGGYPKSADLVVTLTDRSDRGTTLTATTLTALLVTGLVALGLYAHHLADQDCHQRASTDEAHELCEVLSS
jgi:hypothetical protein